MDIIALFSRNNSRVNPMYYVLYVDDEQDLLELAKLYLEFSHEFSISISTSAQEVLKAQNLQLYDAIISDYQMPGIDGIAFLKQVRNNFGDVPFILFTGRGREDVVIDAINNGADFYLQKGGDPKSQFTELVHKIKTAVDQRRAKLALKGSEKRLTEIIDFLPDATFAIDLEGTVIAWNRAMEEMTSLKKEEIIGKGNFEHALPLFGNRQPLLLDLLLKNQDEIKEKYPFINQSENRFTSEKHVRNTSDGKDAYFWFVASPLYDADGKINGAIESIRNISKQKQTEQSLLESEEKFRFIFDTQKNGLLIIDATTRTILDANASAVRLIDMPADQIIGRGYRTFISPQESGKSPSTDPCHTDGNAYGTLIDGKGRQIPITTDTTEATIGGRKILIETFADIPERTMAE